MLANTDPNGVLTILNGTVYITSLLYAVFLIVYLSISYSKGKENSVSISNLFICITVTIILFNQSFIFRARDDTEHILLQFAFSSLILTFLVAHWFFTLRSSTVFDEKKRFPLFLTNCVIGGILFYKTWFMRDFYQIIPETDSDVLLSSYGSEAVLVLHPAYIIALGVMFLFLLVEIGVKTLNYLQILRENKLQISRRNLLLIGLNLTFLISSLFVSHRWSTFISIFIMNLNYLVFLIFVSSFRNDILSRIFLIQAFVFDVLIFDDKGMVLYRYQKQPDFFKNYIKGSLVAGFSQLFLTSENREDIQNPSLRSINYRVYNMLYQFLPDKPIGILFAANSDQPFIDELLNNFTHNFNDFLTTVEEPEEEMNHKNNIGSGQLPADEITKILTKTLGNHLFWQNS